MTAEVEPLKMQRSRLWAAVGGRLLIYIHEEKMLEHVQRLHPARRYVMVDDKLRILAPSHALTGQSLVARRGGFIQ